MQLITPAFGLLFWMVVTFLLVLFVLGKFAWPVILKSLSEREQSISEALQAAKRAKEEMAALQADNDELLRKTRAERDLVLKEARDTRDQIIAEARTKATSEANKIMAQTRESILNEKMAAITELKNQVATMSIDIAEKILRQELSQQNKQKMLMEDLLKDVSMK